MPATTQPQGPQTASDSPQGPRRTERFRKIYDSTHDDLWRYCLRRTASPDIAEDVLGETFAVAWRRLDDVPPAAGRLRNGLLTYRRVAD